MIIYQKIPKLQNDKGFLLIETILAIALIAIGLFSVMSLTIGVIRGNSHSKMVTAATTLAQDKMEYFKGIDYDSIADTSTISTDYYLEAIVQNNTPGIDSKTVTINVYWNPGEVTSNHKVTLHTIFAK
ncbi:MAG: hypothetical protein DCC43_14730 [Candidatus Brocadia sp.]|uniref:Prepilin-type N-terminal cleavage/methylation domain-containing protein n=1 Tax=Candidatus Brocadia fulgida TaxID=380242 RepID=A0A0M2UVV6_9BACT|nr:MAG: hypothetical protein BROFUL_01251 [Candidatus Brocadia fulgida]MCC6324566.1 hypothetical protein [Candidatus Brocadia sp.]MCE7912319.1 hypothetical protein [Candidatus Brocadia sp. AMX3]MDG5997908.1 hypothetical protein [Candidatus Brocadia sp.]RIJ90635.1 MAG: hypothetical protein DCC43_14730 [Candidatus Brocadia sp.]